jgi:hypothetical protein
MAPDNFDFLAATARILILHHTDRPREDVDMLNHDASFVQRELMQHAPPTGIIRTDSTHKRGHIGEHVRLNAIR